MSDRVRKGKLRRFGYWECLRAARKSGFLPPLAVGNEFDSRPYSHVVYDLTADGLPYFPAVSYFSLGEYEMRSPWHRHRNCVECIFCLRGDMKYESDGREFDLRPLHMFVSRQDELHRQVSDGRKVVYSALKVSTARKDWISSGFCASEWEWAMKGMKALPRCFFGGKSVEKDIHELFRVLQLGDDRSNERRFRLRAVSARLLLDMIDAANAPRSRSRDVISGIVREMESNPEMRISMDDLVERLHLSLTGVLNAFKSATGLSPHAFQLKCCVDRAKELLSRGESVESVAARLGFASRQHFSATFKRFAGTSPSAWRDRHIKTQM
jgi:AraC-like DNA-binding protein/mannose-6-phosphate isomerase-like protein (cupin superfamily)